HLENVGELPGSKKFFPVVHCFALDRISMPTGQQNIKQKNRSLAGSAKECQSETRCLGFIASLRRGREGNRNPVNGRTIDCYVLGGRFHVVSLRGQTILSASRHPPTPQSPPFPPT